MSDLPPAPGRRPEPDRRPAVTWTIGAGLVALILLLIGLGLAQAHRSAMELRLLATPMNDIPTHPDLVRFASNQARPIFARHCAGCHGADMKGLAATGAPNLTDKVTLYGDDVFHIERTILYGVRSGQKKANDITEMPAFGQRGQLTSTDISNVVQYLLKLNHRPYNPDEAVQGQAVYLGKGLCFDCHADDAKGNTDYGAPDLTANVWDFGGDPRSLYDSIYYGRHGVMPTWIGKLTLEQIRALAVYVHAASH